VRAHDDPRSECRGDGTGAIPVHRSGRMLERTTLVNRESERIRLPRAPRRAAKVSSILVDPRFSGECREDYTTLSRWCLRAPVVFATLVAAHFLRFTAAFQGEAGPHKPTRDGASPSAATNHDPRHDGLVALGSLIRSPRCVRSADDARHVSLGVAQLARALVSGARERRFDSCRPDPFTRVRISPSVRTRERHRGGTGIHGGPRSRAREGMGVRLPPMALRAACARLEATMKKRKRRR
jgi:hypothetical protein